MQSNETTEWHRIPTALQAEEDAAVMEARIIADDMGCGLCILQYDGYIDVLVDPSIPPHTTEWATAS